MGKCEIYFLAKGTLNNSEDRQRKEDQKYQVPPSHPLYREKLFQIHPEKQVATRKLKNKYLRDL